MSALVAVDKGEARVDSRALAAQLELQHESLVKILQAYAADFEQLGVFRFEIGKSKRPGRPERFVHLNEDQCYLLLTFARNTPHVRALKVRLVKAFGEARQSQSLGSIEYLPGYHQLHDRVHELAGGSPNERFVHMNLNKLVNKTVGIASGARPGLPAPQKALVIVAQQLASKALARATDHHDGYEMVKDALGAFGQVLIGSDVPLQEKKARRVQPSGLRRSVSRAGNPT